MGLQVVTSKGGCNECAGAIGWWPLTSNEKQAARKLLQEDDAPSTEAASKQDQDSAGSDSLAKLRNARGELALARLRHVLRRVPLPLARRLGVLCQEVSRTRSRGGVAYLGHPANRFE